MQRYIAHNIVDAKQGHREEWWVTEKECEEKNQDETRAGVGTKHAARKPRTHTEDSVTGYT